MKGKVLLTVSVFTGCLLWSPFSNADSLIIRFNSGKTQQVALEESEDNVVNIQTQATGTLGDKNVLSRELYNKEISRTTPETPTDNKKSYRLKWGAPKLGE
jgi:hypothetical protein